MFSDIKENVFSYKHTRNLRREIETTGKQKKNGKTKIHYLKKKKKASLDEIHRIKITE